MRTQAYCISCAAFYLRAVKRELGFGGYAAHVDERIGLDAFGDDDDAGDSGSAIATQASTMNDTSATKSSSRRVGDDDGVPKIVVNADVV